MASIPNKVVDRIKDKLSSLQKILEQAKSRDINEADTVVIVSDVLCDLFGYDKYEDITREYAIKAQYCDLAVKIDGSLKFLIEVKAIGITLQDKHYQQALDYGANNGTEWIVLTNGITWKVYRVRFEKPIRTDFICEFNLSEMKAKNQNDVEKLFILCKEGIKKNAIEEFSTHRTVVNRYTISAVLTSDMVIDSIKKEIRKLNSSVKPDEEEIIAILKNDVLKREVIDTPEAKDALDKYNKAIKKIDREKAKNSQDKNDKDIVIEENEKSESSSGQDQSEAIEVENKE